MDYDAYINSREWQEKRRGALDRAGNKCQFCSRTRKLQVHHNTYERLGRELDTDLCVLCGYCHKILHQVRDGKATRMPVKSTNVQRPSARDFGRKHRIRRRLLQLEIMAGVSFDGVTEVTTITHNIINRLRSPNGGWGIAAIQLMGLPWPLVKGWKKAMLGRVVPISEEQMEIEIEKIRSAYDWPEDSRSPSYHNGSLSVVSEITERGVGRPNPRAPEAASSVAP